MVSNKSQYKNIQRAESGQIERTRCNVWWNNGRELSISDERYQPKNSRSVDLNQRKSLLSPWELNCWEPKLRKILKQPQAKETSHLREQHGWTMISTEKSHQAENDRHIQGPKSNEQTKTVKLESNTNWR